MTGMALDMREVSKRYRFFALERVDLTLEYGQVMGLVGANGAGKSTTLRILTGLVQPDAGSVEVLGHAMPQDQVQAKRDIGHVSEDMRLYGRQTVAWHMDLVRSIYPTWDEAHAGHLLRRFHLRREQRVKELSRGEHVKALLMLALARRPRLLVLDEPTAGLDPVARHELITELMDVLRDEQRSIVFSSHNTVDVEQIADRISFMDRGQVVESQDKEAFLDAWRRLHLELPDEDERSLSGLPGVVDFSRSGRTVVLTTRAFEAGLPAACAQAGAHVREVQRMTLEEIFVANVMARRREASA